MKRLALCVVLAAFAAVIPVKAETLDEILAKHFTAIGGKDKIAKVQTVKMTGKQQMGPQEVPLTIYWKRPNKVRVEFTLQGMTGIQAFDGTKGWMVMPFMGKTEPEAITGDDLKELNQQSDMIEGPLYDWKAKGNQVELVGKEAVEGTDAWKLKLTRKSGDVEYIYLDAESMLQIKSEGKHKRGDTEMEIESSIGDYKETGGLVLPHSIESKPKGAPQGAMITIDKIEFGTDIADALFAMPEKKPEPTPAAGK
jgi:outer membrane lipoprotein-sorting protein